MILFREALSQRGLLRRFPIIPKLTSLLYSENSACASFEEEIGEVIKMLSPGVSASVGTMSKVSRRLLPSPLLSQWPFTSVCWGFLGGVVVERLGCAFIRLLVPTTFE